MKIVEVDEQQHFVKMLVYGASGVGKTRFGSTAPDSLYLSCEGGLLSVRGRKQKAVNIEKFDDIQEAYMELKAGKYPEYKTVIVDSLTEIQKMHMDSLLEKKKILKPTIEQWGENIEAMRKLCRAFRDLPMHIILITLERQEKNEETGTIRVLPALQGSSLPQEVMGFFDIVGYFVAEEKVNKEKQAKEIVRAIRVQPTSGIYAKDRTDRLGTWIQPDFKIVLDKLIAKGETK